MNNVYSIFYTLFSVSEKVKIKELLAKYIDPVYADPVFKQKYVCE